jgi:hypothetical protein
VKLTVSPLAWFLITVYGALGALILWGALEDPWWLGVAVWLLLLSRWPGEGAAE